MNSTAIDTIVDKRQHSQARASAEALFTPKPSPSEHVAEANSPLEAERKPRVLSAVMPTGKEAKPNVETKPGIPTSDVARVRTWVQYGIKLRDIAAMYGIAADDVRQALRKAEIR